MVASVIFLITNDLKKHVEYENPFNIFENMDYFQIMLLIMTCGKFQNI